MGSSAATFGTGTLTIGAPGSSVGINLAFASSTTYANPITVNAGGQRYFYGTSGGAPTFSGAITLVGGANFAVGPNNNLSITLSGGSGGTGNLAFGSPIAGRTSNVFISGGTLNNIGFLADSVLATPGFGYGAENTGTATIQAGAQIGANVTALLQDSASNSFVLANTNSPFFGDSVVSAGTLQIANTTALQNSVVNVTSTATTPITDQDID